MSHQYQVRVYNTAGVQVALLVDWTSLHLEKRVNQIYNHTLVLPYNQALVDLFTQDALVEVRRRDPSFGLDNWYTEYIGLHITPQDTTSNEGRQLFTSYGRGLADLLHRRTIRYYAGSAYSTKSGFAETVMKQYVRENAGSLAVVPPRLTDGVTTGLIVAPNLGTGPVWSGSAAWKNLLSILQEIAAATGVDYDVTWNGTNGFTFTTYYPQLGTSHTVSDTNPVIFELFRGNMGNPSYVKSRTEEVNDILVLGQGQEDARAVRQRTTAATADSIWNRREGIADDRQDSLTASLDAYGDAKLEELQAREELTFDLIQTASSVYGLHYNLGDIVTAKYRNIQVNKKVIGVTIHVAAGKEDINIELGDIAS